MQAYLKDVMWQSSSLGTFRLGAQSSILSFVLDFTKVSPFLWEEVSESVVAETSDALYRDENFSQNTALSYNLVLTVNRSDRAWNGTCKYYLLPFCNLVNWWAP